MTIDKATKVLREKIGPRGDHHRNCGSQEGEKCDCYAKGREDAHEALDFILNSLFANKPEDLS